MTNKKQRRKAKYRLVHTTLQWTKCPKCRRDGVMSIYQNEYATSLFFEIKHCEYKTGVFDQLDYAIEEWESICVNGKSSK